MTERKGYRGYMASRPFLGIRVPQHVQNLVIRDHARRHGLHHLLSAVEYTMPGCFLMLGDVMAELPAIEGMIAYSLFMLPEDGVARAEFWRLLLSSGARFHAALEDLVVATPEDVARAEDLWLVKAFAVERGLE